MSWRLHLTNQAIHRLHILPGKRSLLAVWSQRNRISYFALTTGAPVGERVLRTVTPEPQVELKRLDAKWLDFVGTLVAPNQAVLPFVSTPLGDLQLSSDGRMHLYHTGGPCLILVRGGEEVTLKLEAERLIAVAFDRYLGLIGALDEQGRLHLYQQENRVGVFDIGLKLRPELPYSLRVSQGGGTIFATDGQQIVIVEADGKVRKRLPTHYYIHRLECSLNGRVLMTCDLETNVLRVYDGVDLTATHQRHADDLLSQAEQIQLLADMPPAHVALTALDVNNKGVIAFALAGVICVSSVDEMTRLPLPRKLV